MTTTDSPGYVKRSKRLYIYWGVALTFLLALGLLCWLVVVPVLQVRQAMKRCDSVPWRIVGWKNEADVEIERLGGREEALLKLQFYLRLPERLAPGQCTAVAMLGVCGSSALPALLGSLGDERVYVRGSAAWALGEVGDPRAVESLIVLLTDKSGMVSAVAAEALGRIRDPRAFEPLMASLKSEDVATAGAAAVALAEIGDPRAVQPLIDMLKERRLVHAWVAAALGKLKARQSVEALIAILQNNDPGSDEWVGYEAMCEAAWALGEIGDRRSVGPLEAALKDPKAVVRISASKALKKIKAAQEQSK